MKQKVIKQISKYSGGSLVSTIGNLSQKYVAARILGPELFGLWNGYKLILKYVGKLDFGIPNATRREIAINRGEGSSHTEIETIQNTLVTFLLISGLLAAGVTLGYSFWYTDDYLYSLTVKIISGLIIITRIKDFYSPLFKSKDMYHELGIIEVTVGMIDIIGIILIFIFGYHGFLIAQLIRAMVQPFFGFNYIPTHLSLGINWNKLWELAAIGIPIVTGSMGMVFFKTVDRLLIFNLLGSKELGFYTLSVLVFIPVNLTLTSVHSVFYQRFAEQYGASKDLSEMVPLIVKPIKVVMYAFPLIMGIVFVWLQFFTELLLPQYLPGVVAAKIVLLGLLFRATTGILRNFLTTIDELLLVNILVYSGVGINVLVSGLFIFNGYGIEGVALGTGITYFVLFGTIYYLSLSYCELSVSAINWNFLMNVIVPFSVIIGFFFLSLYGFSPDITNTTLLNKIAELLVKSLVLVCVSIPFMLSIADMMDIKEMLFN